MIAPTVGENVVLFMKDPKNCGGCILNDAWNQCCKAARKAYGPEHLVGYNKPSFCPLHPMLREPYGNFKVVTREEVPQI